MKMNYIIVLTIVLASVVFNSATADTEINKPPKVPLDAKSSFKVNDSDSVNKKVDMGMKSKYVNLSNSDLSKQLETNKAINGNLRDAQKDNDGTNSKSKEEAKLGRLRPPRAKCDSSSNSCTDDDKTLIACLRVPGDDSPDLSLLIQNEGKGPIRVTIFAPDFVRLENKEIQIPEKDYSEVRVPIKNAGSGDFIILTAGHGNCSLDFKDLIGRKNIDSTSQFSYINLIKRPTSIGFVFLAALLLLAAWSCTRVLKRYFMRNPKYQKLDMELPVSHGSKLETGSNQGWDESWGDSWDDEEASKAPSLPVTPSFSSKGIASRKFSKEGWKD